MTQSRKLFLQIVLIVLGFVFSLMGMAQETAKPGATAVARFLEQASWGPTAASVAHVEDVGFDGYLTEQFQAPPAIYTVPPPGANGRIPYRPLQDQFFYSAVNGHDQLRQRVVFALSQMWVVSGVKLTDPTAMVNYLQLLQKDAFANYYDLMYDITLSPAMGHYLDMVNNDKPNPKLGTGANENYAREVMQLFNIGLNELNPDGALQTDSAGNPIPTYTQDTIEGFSRAFTGWTYAPAPGAVSRLHNPPNWTAPMVAWDSNHDLGAKELLNGTTLPAHQSAAADLQGALQNIFNHPNVGPFVCRQLIQRLVTSNPSPGYVARVAAVFDGEGQTPRGDMKAVISAILLDPEARQGDDAPPAAGEGHLREPVLFINALLRALGATVQPASGLAGYSAMMGQNLFFAPTVFNFYAPGYEIPGAAVNAPEFQILSTSTAMLRADFVNSVVYGNIPGVSVDLTPFIRQSVDAHGTLNSGKLMSVLNAALMDGEMSANMSAIVQNAVNAATTSKTKTQSAVYLIATSWPYQVER